MSVVTAVLKHTG